VPPSLNLPLLADFFGETADTWQQENFWT